MPADKYDPATPEGRAALREIRKLYGDQTGEELSVFDLDQVMRALPRLLAMAAAGEELAKEAASAHGGCERPACWSCALLTAWERAKKGGE